MDSVAHPDIRDNSLSPAAVADRPRLPTEVKTSTRNIVLGVTGMTCSSCVANIERHLSKCDGELLCKNLLESLISHCFFKLICSF